MQQTSGELSYDEWVAYCFDRDPTTSWWHEIKVDEDGEWFEADWYEPEPRLVVGYLRRLFMESAQLPSAYSPEQLGKGLWFLCCQEAGCHLRAAFSPVAPQDDRIACVMALKHLYTDLFAKLCTQHFSYIDRGPEASGPLNGACYMLWEMSGLTWMPKQPGFDFLADPVLEVLAFVLRSPNEACVESALHGLGHLQHHFPDRVPALIDSFLKDRPNLSPELYAYAGHASRGQVL